MANRHHKRSNDGNNPSSREAPSCLLSCAHKANSFIGSVYHQIAGYLPGRLVGMWPLSSCRGKINRRKLTERWEAYLTLPETFRTVGTLQNGHERYEEVADPGIPAPRGRP